MIWNYMPYKDNDGNDLLFLVVTGNNVTVNAILGSTMIDQWELELKFNHKEVVSHKLRTTLELEFIDTVRVRILQYRRVVTPEIKPSRSEKDCGS